MIAGLLFSLLFLSRISLASVVKSWENGGCGYKFEIINHRPCGVYDGPSDERIRFPPNKDTTVFREPNCGCYKISGGAVNIYKTVQTSSLYLYTQLQMGGLYSSDRFCAKPDPNGCGGFGSCVYCNICENYSHRFVRLDEGAPNCNRYWMPGQYKNITLSICPPSKEEILDSINSRNRTEAEIVFNNQIGSRYGVYIRLRLRLFDQSLVPEDKRINTLNPTQLRFLNWKEKTNMIGCHFFHARISQ